MYIGVPREVKEQEFRIGLTPDGVQALVAAGHRVVIETRAGERIGLTDDLYRKAGALIGMTPQDIYKADMVVKVKEPLEPEIALMHEGQVIFCFLHLAAAPEMTKKLLEKKVIGIAYETVEDEEGQLPLLRPMSQIAGRIAVQEGAVALQLSHGGRGVMLGGMPGVARSHVVVLGGGTSGKEAIRLAIGMGASVTVFDISTKRLRDLYEAFYRFPLETVYSTKGAIEHALKQADLVIGAVLIPGKSAPKVLTREMIGSMPKGSVFVDISIDQGGCSETSIPTTHANPTYSVDDVIHYCVTNIPSACASTATKALTSATLRYIQAIAGQGLRALVAADPGFAKGINLYQGQVTNENVAIDLQYPYVRLQI